MLHMIYDWQPCTSEQSITQNSESVDYTFIENSERQEGSVLMPQMTNQFTGLNCRRKERILIVDDQVFNLDALAAILIHKFMVPQELIDTALNGEQALEKVVNDIDQNSAATYKLILMDCNMPFMDGFQCTMQIRSLLNKQRNLRIEEQPVISAVTGHSEGLYIRKCFKHGMNQVLTKPVEHRALEAALQSSGFKSYKRTN